MDNKNKELENMKTSRTLDMMSMALAEDSPESKRKQGRLTPAEQKAYIESGKTQGRTGLALPRIHMAMTPANYEMVMVLSKLKGMTYTKFVNKVLDEYREKNKEVIEEAKAFTDKLEGSDAIGN